MQAVIPAAGEGTRLRPLTAERPKALVEVAGRPILTHCFEALLSAPIEGFVVVVGYRGQQIVDRYGDAYRGVPIEYAWQDDQRGLGHAVLQAREFVDDDFLVLNGDNVVRAAFDRVVEAHRSPGVDGTVFVTEVSEAVARGTGVVVVEDGRVVRIAEKSAEPPSLLANAGCYTLPPAIFEACERVQPGAEGEYQLSDAVDALCRAGYTFCPVRLEGWRVNVNTPADIERAEAKLEGT